jgi:hypothetical protein
MRFCVYGRQPYSVIKNADEIKCAYADKDRILDLVERYPEKTVILDVPGFEEDWKLWQMYNERFAEFYIALHDLSRVAEFNQAGIKWYWPYPITTYYELGMIVNLHPSYLLIGAPLSFDLDKMVPHTYDDCMPENADPIPLRMVVNVAHPSYLPTNGTHGICGQWVRPEDTKVYSTRIRCFEFGGIENLKEEATILDVYRKQEWPGNLNFIIKNLDYNVDNRAIPEEVGQRRMTCGQRCWSGSGCHLCVSAFQFADALRKKHIARSKEGLVDNN